MTESGPAPAPGHDDSPVEAYLDRLLIELIPGSPREIRHLLAETEAHLRDAAQEEVAAGRNQAEAEIEAVGRFGPPAELAGAERQRGLTPVSLMLRQCLASVWFLGAVGAVAVGVSGVVAGVLRAVGGERFIIDVAPGQVLAASDCARWLAGNPGAQTCRQAAISDWAAETVFYRIALGLVGVLALVAFFAMRRRLHQRSRWVSLPSTVVDTVAVTLFGLGGIWLLGLGVDAVIVSSGHGAGQWLSAAPVALAAATAFGLRLLHDLRSAGPEPAELVPTSLA